MKFYRAFLALVMMLAAPAVHAQRAAISPDLSPEDAAAAFTSAVLDSCLPAVAQGKPVADIAGARIVSTSDAETRRQAGAAPGDAVWDVAAARGVVTVSETAGRCTVQVYGPPAAPTLMALAQRLKAPDQGFESMMAAGGGLSQTLMRGDGAARVLVTIKGAEPGMPNHSSRFSVVSASVSRVN
jgi:hypothetical protein